MPPKKKITNNLTGESGASKKRKSDETETKCNKKKVSNVRNGPIDGKRVVSKKTHNKQVVENDMVRKLSKTATEANRKNITTKRKSNVVDKNGKEIVGENKAQLLFHMPNEKKSGFKPSIKEARKRQKLTGNTSTKTPVSGSQISVCKVARNRKETVPGNILEEGNTFVVNSNEDTSSDESDWEEVVDDTPQDLSDYKPDIPEGGVEIILESTTVQRRKPKKTFDMMEYIRLEINRGKKDHQLVVHQVHMLCLLARWIYVNNLLNSDEPKALALSYIPQEFCQAHDKIKINADFIKKLVDWFRTTFIVDLNFKVSNIDIMKTICKSFQFKIAPSSMIYNMLFVILARAISLTVRLCVSLYPVSYKAMDLLKKGAFNGEKSSESKVIQDNNAGEGSSKTNIQVKKHVSDDKKVKVKKITNKQSVKPVAAAKKHKHKAKISARVTPKRLSQKKNYKLSSDDEDVDNCSDDDFVLNDDVSSDDEPKKKYTKKHSFYEKAKEKNRKILSSESGRSSPETNDSKSDIECWVEVYSPKEEKWVSVECFNNLYKPYDIEKSAKQPISYVISLDNHSFVKDITKRYTADWMTQTRKLRVVQEWWLETLVYFLPPDTKQNRNEDSQMEVALMRKPMPSSIGEFKNHPLYALKRHLLKFQAIYPSDAPSVGFVRSEPVYARECVHTLHSREAWLKEARLVRIGEEPYKIVKARPKWDKLTGVVKTDLPLQLFGRWQTEEYMPPIAWNGKVPRNEYGNVELFKPCMLPIGTVHLRNPGLQRIAKKLNIDCSPAVVGFDGHKGSVHAVFDGFIICEEFKDTILAAWEEEQENIRKREEEKREKRVYGNWKKLIKGLLIRERIKKKYSVD